jgi:para-aminobenzoate synthetase component 2
MLLNIHLVMVLLFYLLAHFGFRHKPRLLQNRGMGRASDGRAKILVIDNYDSFVFNLVQYLGQIGAECVVIRNDEVKPEDAKNYDGVLISPGPGTPEEAGVSIAMVKYCAVAFGGTVSRAPELLHGKTSRVAHNNKGVLVDLPSPLVVTRYHSLSIEPETMPHELEVICETESGVVMGIQHKTLPISGVQFHPESVLTEHGHQMLGNWLVVCGDLEARKRSEGLSPVVIKA